MKDYLKRIVSYAGLALGLIIGSGCSSKYDVHGFVVNEKRWEQPGFGQLYRIEVAPTASSTRGSPFVFVGSNEELEELDKKINVGDKVMIDDKSVAFSLSLEKVLIPEQIKKK